MEVGDETANMCMAEELCCGGREEEWVGVEEAQQEQVEKAERVEEAELEHVEVEEEEQVGVEEAERVEVERVEEAELEHVEVEEEQVGVEVERVEAMRCQVKITTRQSLQLRMANYTARDVYVRLLGHGARISGTGVLALKDSVHLSPLRPPLSQVGPGEEGCHVCFPGEQAGLEPATEEQQAHSEQEEVEEALTISELAYSPCASMLPTPVEDGGGVDLLFQSPVKLLKELHADRQLEAELEEEQAGLGAGLRAEEAELREVRRVLGGGLRRLAGNVQTNACLRSLARLLVVGLGLLLVLLPLLLVLLESDIDVSFLRDIRQTPEFQQFHYEYYCPLRRWLVCKISVVMEKLGAD